MQAISFEKKDERQAKFLTVLLNSSLTAWFLFHHSSNTGMERDKVHQEQLLDIPFPLPEQTCDENQSRQAFNQGVKLIEHLLKQKDKLLQSELSEYMSDIDKIVYNYFGLCETDILLIEDTLKHVIPSMQPRARSKNFPSLWKDTYESDWEHYSKWFSFGLNNWLEKSYHAVVELIGSSPDLVVVGIHLTDDSKRKYFENNRNTNGIDQILNS
ncbi:MAG: hypothetical protein KZQ64_04725 [gamma proteobacterium symbiont of Bathyaustriella thionipta]|nr:hypothetical protein [gamma proteobacterium symbiont of Bathyaustriella thionipta]MCU7951490.1 hypothetical protein [gamma proteobacterium symbiont of Bathyaustriella thionipta]MCU7952684.1 hypothetical protein [gamma proteobacterium symbiont of Bathyaustriella thionipta]MCU7958058.1 hypothetical protein [gamma proteobacterium symbiont of Bathyaustriella thionipta]MCU7967115.1 hypothetical protein [gamma proteobacterium symbiont of Bathyaustriella thionipta]